MLRKNTMETLETNKIKSYCQFCLKLQSKDDLKMPISRKIKQNFFILTSKKLITSSFCEFICCQPCLDEFESFCSYRSRLITNQRALEDLNRKLKHNQPKPNEQLEEPEKDEIEIEIIAEEVPDVYRGEETETQKIEEVSVCEESQDVEINETSQLLQSTIEYEILEDEEYLDEEHIIEDELEEYEIHFKPDDEFDETGKKKYHRKRLKDPIKCPKCSRLFFYKSYFAFHYKDVHSQDRCEVCQYCGKVFKNARRLNSHILVHSVGEKRFKCETCGKEFNYSGDLLRHKRIHENNKPFRCTFEDCGKSFVQSYALKLHLDVHNRVKYKCDNCGSQYSVKTTLKNHMQKCINGVQSQRPARYRSASKSVDRERYKCFIQDCEREFSSRKYLGVHLEKSHKIKFENFETTCLECQMVFENAGDYAKHVKIHSCSFVCDMCKLRFKTLEKLQSHVEKLHKEGDDRPYVCQEDGCGARFKRTEHLRGHQLYKHSDIKKFECPECPLRFRQRGEFNVHMRVHQDVKPFSCWKCDHLCKTSSNLRQHMRLVHDGETNIYFCDICQATFKYNVDLSQHKKEHGSDVTAAMVSNAPETATVYEILEIVS